MVETKERGLEIENKLRDINNLTADSEGPAVRRLSPCELEELRQDMAESSAWAKAELKRRRDAKNQKNSAHGIDDGIEKGCISN
ncbi:hypothetical protein NMS22_001927 [Vibrio cholerae]|uniref:hypothetical protein n=1 Tax=Shewanella algae TaxID=38313 RepID=UPI001AAC9B2E|nr:hypothetical protein [Shewanella algae]EJL6487429.1 hypothetical protein [Vibrio cholerae]MBO2556155.1 hypothetical protein [Shewanella algae]MBO2573088.1 hypothetical protein [Shewanella algae]